MPNISAKEILFFALEPFEGAGGGNDILAKGGFKIEETTPDNYYDIFAERIRQKLKELTEDARG